MAAVMGWPIAHSRSPKLHGHWLRRYGIAGYYVPIGVPPEDFEAALRSMPRLGFRGTNVTLPHKQAALAIADVVSDEAELIGAANTLSFLPEGGIHAHNTDGYGFTANLRQAAPNWSAAAGPALILGAGGAARAIVAALLAEGAWEVRIANRTRARAVELRDHFGDKVLAVDWEAASEATAGAMTIVNTSALGMVGQSALDIDLGAAPEGALVNDIVYEPLETPLLTQARARGLCAVDGLGMLLHQGVPGFERWFGRRPEVDDDLRAAVLGK